MKKLQNYVKREWLNNDDSSYTGSVVSFHGQSPFDKKDFNHAFLEIADCGNKICLHAGRHGKDKDIKNFIKKLKRLRNHIDMFIEYLETKS